MKRTLQLEAFNDQQKCLTEVILSRFTDFSTELKSIKPLTPINYDVGKKALENLRANGVFGTEHEVLNYDLESQILLSCMLDEKSHSFTKCNQVDEKLIRKTLTGDLEPIQSDGYSYFPMLNVRYSPKISEGWSSYDIHGKNVHVTVPAGQTLYLYLQAQNSEIDIELKSPASQVVIYQSEVKDSKVTIRNSESDGFSNEVRYNTKGLTGCVTAVDSVFHNVDFEMVNCPREDALNFIRVHGNLIKATISGASYGLLMQTPQICNARSNHQRCGE